MFKVSILKDNIQTHGATFNTLLEAEAWIAEGTDKNYWGSNFTSSVEDITQEVERQKKVQQNLARMNFGALLMAELAADNQAAFLAQELTIEQIIEIEASLKDIQRLLYNGSLSLAVAALQMTTVPHLPQAKKDAFLLKMTTYLGAE